MQHSYFSQNQFPIRCEWGLQGIRALQPQSDVIIIVDVLSFSTCVDIAVSNQALVYPYPWKDESAQQFATLMQAILAQPRHSSATAFSLSPASLLLIPAQTRLVLPSPNGATLSGATGSIPTLAGCLRNAQAIAQQAQAIGQRISVIAAGERWEDGSLRPAIEDWLGAGAIIAHLAGTRSPEAETACSTFLALQSHLSEFLRECGSGRELVEQGFGEDVQLAAELNVSRCVPIMRDKAYQQSNQ